MTNKEKVIHRTVELKKTKKTRQVNRIRERIKQDLWGEIII